jgi:hypothetical protein
MTLTDEEADVLRRAASDPDVDSGVFDPERDRRLYQPLLRRGLLQCEVRPYPPDADYEIVHYQTTEEGLRLLQLYDRAHGPS